MGIFDGISLKSIIRDTSNIVGAFTGAAPIQDQQPQTNVTYLTQPIEAGRSVNNTVDVYSQAATIFGESLGNFFRNQPAREEKFP